MRRIPAHVTTFRELLDWLAETQHKGKYYPISKKARIASATVDQWRHGVITTPGRDTTLKLCDAYDLPVGDVLRLLGWEAPRVKPRRPVISGGSDTDNPPAAVAQLSDNAGASREEGALCQVLAGVRNYFRYLRPLYLAA